jgi:RNA polymerase sigma-70 factor (ECF subfamily)
MTASTTVPGSLETRLEQHRLELRAYCYRMLGSPFEAEDAVQETIIRAWRGFDAFEGRSSLRSWLYRIATNVCLDMLKSSERRAIPMDFGPAQEPVITNLHERPEATWLEPVPDALVVPTGGDPAEAAVTRDSVRLAFMATLQHLPPRQRAVLILCEVLQWKAAEVAELLDSSVASVNSALQRARTTIEANRPTAAPTTLTGPDRELLERYVTAFEAYDMTALTAVIHEDAIQSMPPYDMWISGRDDVFAWWFGPGIACAGSRVVETTSANGMPTFAQYKPSPGGGYSAWALQVVELRDGLIGEITFFLNVERLFPLFDLPLRLDA